MIVTENFILDKLRKEDAQQLHQFMMENKERFKVFFPVTLSNNETLEKSKEYIEVKNSEIQERTNFTFAIRAIDSQIIVGLIIIKKIDWTARVGELAYCITNKHEGKGLTTKAVEALSYFAFEELKLKKLQIIAHKTNIGSVKVALNNGFIWNKILKNEFTPINETPLDMELYELKNEK
ncbi:ribosomal-protein-alanine N-acetyltransferase [Flavobacterium sp. PL11]|uniref:GNAT family N-acetyltransferase n=1 Tax=Flavobacterium sp. PL11 TaxID=3071717 RepID=UPI002E06BED4|nr:ribosomal-protein-alanine N-acetyltransferase [Flavobacterium sp. PL11]